MLRLARACSQAAAAATSASAARIHASSAASRTALTAAHTLASLSTISNIDRRCSSTLIAATPLGSARAPTNLAQQSTAVAPASPLALSSSAALSPSSPRRLLSTALPQVGAPLRRKVTTVDLIAMKQRKQKISMVTAYTYPSAVHVDAADIDVLLVGDSVGMVELGYDTTLPVTVDDMIYHCKAVSRGAERALLVADLPFGSYEASPQQAYATAIRFLKECGMDCVKLEGGAQLAEHVRVLVRGGVAVMGHIGLTPQRISVLGGFRAQGKTLEAAQLLLADALALQEAGCFSLVIECVPAEVAELITRTLRIPTIGIGAGKYTDGQVLVFHDMLGMFQHAHHAKVSPSFCKRYASIGSAIQTALNEYKKDVSANDFPSDQYSPYKLLNDEEKDKFKRFAEDSYKRIEEQAAAKAKAKGTTSGAKATNTKEQAAAFEETIKVY